MNVLAKLEAFEDLHDAIHGEWKVNMRPCSKQQATHCEIHVVARQLFNVECVPS